MMSGLPTRWEKLVALIGRLNVWLGMAGGAAVCVMVFIVAYDVAMRYFFMSPTIWALDIGEMLMLPAVYLPAALLLREGGHIQVDLLTSRIRGRALKVDELAVYLIGLAWCGIMLWRSSLVLGEFVQRGKLSTMAALPLSPAVFFIPLGLTLLTLEFLVRIVDTTRNLKRDRVA